MKTNFYLTAIFGLFGAFLTTCSLEESPLTTATVSTTITQEYLINGDLDEYLQNEQVFRYTGKPGIETVPIGLGSLSDFERCFVLYVSTGGEGIPSVSAAIIKLDGIEILNCSNFDGTFKLFSFEVCDLTPQSAMDIEVRGTVGSYVNIWIEGKLKQLTVTDCSGNIYPTVQIGTQIWMAENLRATCLNDGTPLRLCSNQQEWFEYHNRNWSYSWLFDNKETYFHYGAFYCWNVVQTGKLCPIGWHVPSAAEWKVLSDFLGGDLVAGGKLKTTGTIEEGNGLWRTPNVGATNDYGFNALPSGNRNWGIPQPEMDPFHSYKSMAYFWSTDPNYPYLQAITRNLHADNAEFRLGANNYEDGLSVRCIKDN